MKVTKTFHPKDIRNVALVGHTAVGKTALAHELLSRTTVKGLATSRSAPDGYSTSATVHFMTHSKREVNIIDTPGHPELVGQALAALPAVETALIVVDAVAGVQLGTRRMFDAAGERGLARVIVVNRIDQNVGKLGKVYEGLRAELGNALRCINLPSKGATDVIDCIDKESGDPDFGSVEEAHQELLESSIEVDDEQLERYLGGEEIDLQTLRRCFVKAMAVGHLVPVVFTSAETGAGIDDLLHIMVEEFPSPITGRSRRLKTEDDTVEIMCDVDKPFLGHVFYVTTEPQIGKMALIRLLQGTLDSKAEFTGHGEKKAKRAGQMLKISGKEHPELDGTAYAGDIIALTRIDELHPDQILHSPTISQEFEPIRPNYPKPMIALAIEAATRKDETKLGQALSVLTEEDPTLEAGQDSETKEFLIRGLGELHLRSALAKLEERYKIQVNTAVPKVSYRETIAGRAEGHYRHKKQSGGAGQFGEVYLRVEALPRGSGFEFVNATVGGVIPKQFISSVEKGVQDGMEAGPLTGSPMQDVRVTVYDGKTHPVDGKDVAFRIAGKLAFREAVNRANPMVLEPIAEVDISVPEVHTGAVTGDLKQIRGRVMGVEPGRDQTVIKAHIPLAELRNYAGQLSGSTGGAGGFTAEFASYEPVPSDVQAKLQAEYQPGDDSSD